MQTQSIYNFFIKKIQLLQSDVSTGMDLFDDMQYATKQRDESSYFGVQGGSIEFGNHR